MLMTKKGGIYTTEETIHLSRCCFNFFFFFFIGEEKHIFSFCHYPSHEEGKLENHINSNISQKS